MKKLLRLLRRSSCRNNCRFVSADGVRKRMPLESAETSDRTFPYEVSVLENHKEHRMLFSVLVEFYFEVRSKNCVLFSVSSMRQCTLFTVLYSFTLDQFRTFTVNSLEIGNIFAVRFFLHCCISKEYILKVKKCVNIVKP